MKSITRLFKYFASAGISKRYILSMATIYSSIIVLFASGFYGIVFQYTDDVTRIIKKADARSLEALVRTVKTRDESDRKGKADSLSAVRKALERAFEESPELLGAVIYAPTEDENYFEVREIIASPSMKGIALEKKTVVREAKGLNYLRRALVDVTVDDSLYTDEKTSTVWQNAYGPTNPGKKGNFAVQYFVSAERTVRATDSYEKKLLVYAALIFGLAALMMVVVVVMTLVQAHNFTLLVSNLSGFMKKAAGGDLDVNLNAGSDEELSDLALSFNSLIDELKDKNMRLAQEPPQLKEIFAGGVRYLREGAVDQAIGIFSTLSAVNPGKFGTFFNLGVAYAKKREYLKSIDMFQKAVEINPAFTQTGEYIEKVRKLMEQDARP